MNDSKQTLKVEQFPVADLVPYEKNAKHHPQQQVEELAERIAAFGFDQPIVIRGDGEIIKGHGRRLAVMHLGWENVPVVIRDDLTEEEVRLARLSDNAMAGLGEYDAELMAAEMAELADLNPEIDLALAGTQFFDIDSGNFSLMLSGDQDDAPTPEKDGKPNMDTGTDVEDKDYVAQYLITLECSGEAEQEAVYELLTGKGYRPKVQTL